MAKRHNLHCEMFHPSRSSRHRLLARLAEAQSSRLWPGSQKWGDFGGIKRHRAPQHLDLYSSTGLAESCHGRYVDARGRTRALASKSLSFTRKSQGRGGLEQCFHPKTQGEEFRVIFPLILHSTGVAVCWWCDTGSHGKRESF